MLGGCHLACLLAVRHVLSGQLWLRNALNSTLPVPLLHRFGIGEIRRPVLLVAIHVSQARRRSTCYSSLSFHISRRSRDNSRSPV